MQAAFVSPKIHEGFCGFADELRAALDGRASAGAADRDRQPALSLEAGLGDKLAARYREYLETWSLLRYGLMPLRAMRVLRDAKDAGVATAAALRFFHWLPSSHGGGMPRDRLVLAAPSVGASAFRPETGDGTAIAGALVAAEPVLLGTLPGESLGSFRAQLMRDLTLLAFDAGMELDGVLTMRADIGRDGMVSRATVLCDLIRAASPAALVDKPLAMERVLARVRQTRLPPAPGASVLILSLRFGPALPA